MEIWKDIEGYENIYQISNYGKVKSLDRMKYYKNRKSHKIYGQIMSVGDNGNGYKYVTLRKNSKKKNYYVHRLVATAFLDNPKKLPNINHKNFDTSNNRATNLEWCTQKENINYSIESGRFNRISKFHDKRNLKKFLEEIQKINEKGVTKTTIQKMYGIDIKALNKYLPSLINWGTTGMSFNKKRVRCLDTGEIFESIKEANDKYKVKTIGDCLKKRQKTSAGLRWEYV